MSAYVGNPTAAVAVSATTPQVFAAGDRIRITVVSHTWRQGDCKVAVIS
ncbi:hypothetical protein [Streptomyces sp. NPDC058424]